MDYLGTREFGPGHQPFRPGPNPRAPAAAPDSLDYWLGIWIDVYGWLLETAPAGARFVSYEALCRDPGVWADLARAAGLDGAVPAGEAFETRPRPVPEGADPAARARAIHDRLLVCRVRRRAPPCRRLSDRPGGTEHLAAAGAVPAGGTADQGGQGGHRHGCGGGVVRVQPVGRRWQSGGQRRLPAWCQIGKGDVAAVGETR